MRSRRSRTHDVACAVLLAGAALGVRRAEAQQGTVVSGQMEQQGLALRTNGWSATLGIGLGSEPDYPGAKYYRLSPLPLVSITYRRRWFFGPGGVGVNAIRWRGLRAGPVLGFEFGRYQGDYSALHGIGNIQPTATGGVFFVYQAGRIQVNATARQSILHVSYGLSGSVSASYLQPLPAPFALSLGPQVEFADAAYAGTWFGVSPSQAAKSHLPFYAPSGGITALGIDAILTDQPLPFLLFRMFGDLRQYVGTVAHSPIVQRSFQLTIGVGAAYQF